MLIINVVNMLMINEIDEFVFEKEYNVNILTNKVKKE